MIIPAASVAASALAILPVIVERGSWTGLRVPDADCLAAAARRRLAGLVGGAAGICQRPADGNADRLSVALWTAVMLAMDLIDRRTQWRDYWIEWALAAVLIFAGETAERMVAGLVGRTSAFAHAARDLISIFAFPVRRLASRLDRWRLGAVRADEKRRRQTFTRSPIADIFPADAAAGGAQVALGAILVVAPRLARGQPRERILQAYGGG